MKILFRLLVTVIMLLPCLLSFRQLELLSWIRINQLGYAPGSVKVAVWCSKENGAVENFELVDAQSGKVVFKHNAGMPYGAYGPFSQTYRLDFSGFREAGKYYLQVGAIRSPVFRIAEDVYRGAADFCLRYMRQQRSGFNPFLRDSCHTHDGYTMYGPMPDSTKIDVSGGWHDATDYLQYSTTSANATYHLLAAYRDFSKIFKDSYMDNGLEGNNGIADVLDEAKWGLNWMLKMHPKNDWMFNQIADDRDHMGMRLPKEDSFYGKGFERPVYFCTGQPQGLGKYKNRATGVASTAGKFAGAFSLGYLTWKQIDKQYASGLLNKAISAYQMGLKQPGVCQTAPFGAPYFYEEDNWVDDMELAAIQLFDCTRDSKYFQQSIEYARKEPVTPWLGSDTARHYQWYPFINVGHNEIARQKKNGVAKSMVIDDYRQGINKVWQKAKKNAFYRAIPFIWCSNNLTTSFTIQCYWYRRMTNDNSFSTLEQAGFDWLFGCNPWGSAFVYGLPGDGDTPTDPHSSFTHLKNFPIDGGLVDGPVYGNIYNHLIGITLHEPDEYAPFQSELAVYHDDFGDYSTNEPTMDGTASLVYLLAARESEALDFGKNIYDHGAIIRGDTSRKSLAIVFTGDEYADGAVTIIKTLDRQKIKASFFFTGKFYRNPAFRKTIERFKKNGHYLGAHSDQHLLYCDWNNRDSTLVTREQFSSDLLQNYEMTKPFGIEKDKSVYFLPPYEWYNDTIADWTNQLGLRLVNFSPGTLSNTDYTTPDMRNYRNSNEIYRSILRFEESSPSGLNGFILLLHIGTDSKRTDKFYLKLEKLAQALKNKGYGFKTVDDLLNQQ